MIGAGFRFTSRQLFAAIAVLCVTLALFTVQPRPSIDLGAVVVSLGLCAIGVYKRQRMLLQVGFSLAVVSIGSSLYHGVAVAWVGRAKLPVHVLVIDTDTFEPIAGAKIEVFRGPESPLDGYVSAKLKSQLLPEIMEPGIGDLMTDAQGFCGFEHRFVAAGMDGAYEKTGYIDPSSCWLKASAPGRGSVLIPMDQQSSRPRNIQDRSPLFITVPLRLQTKAK